MSKKATMRRTKPTIIKAARWAGEAASGNWVTMAAGMVVAPVTKLVGMYSVILPMTICTAIVSPMARPIPRMMAVVKPGRIMFELEGVTVEMAREAMTRAIYKLPIKAKFVFAQSAATAAAPAASA